MTLRKNPVSFLGHSSSSRTLDLEEWSKKSENLVSEEPNPLLDELKEELRGTILQRRLFRVQIEVYF